MSFTAKMAKVFMNLMTGKPAGSADELLARARKYNAKNQFIKPSDKKALYRVEKIHDGRDLLVVRSKNVVIMQTVPLCLSSVPVGR